MQKDGEGHPDLGVHQELGHHEKKSFGGHHPLGWRHAKKIMGGKHLKVGAGGGT